MSQAGLLLSTFLEPLLPNSDNGCEVEIEHTHFIPLYNTDAHFPNTLLGALAGEAPWSHLEQLPAISKSSFFLFLDRFSKHVIVYTYSGYYHPNKYIYGFT